MSSSSSPSIDNLEQTWRSLIDVCDELTDDEWKRPTGCPGWSVQDTVAHLIDYEARALGRPAPSGDAVSLPHTKNPLGEANEVGVEHRRARPSREVLAEFKEVTAARSEQLRQLTPDDLRREIVTPAGPGTIADMLRLRVMDTWSHEQDIRRAVNRPGHEEGPAVDETVGHFGRFLPLIVGKRAGAPDGAVAVFEIGDANPFTIEVSEGRARPVDDDVDVDVATVRLSMPATTFDAIVGGRSDAPNDVVLAGDEALGRKILAALAFMP